MLKIINSVQDLITLVPQDQFDSIEFLKIDTLNEKLSLRSLEKFIILTEQQHKQIIYINQAIIDNSFLDNLIEMLKKWKKIKDIQIFIDSDFISKKQSIKFILSIKRMYYPKSNIFFSHVGGQIQLKCECCVVRFNYSLNNNFSIKNLKLKYITIEINDEKNYLYNLVKNEIQRDSLSVYLQYNGNSIECYNNKKFKQQIRLIYLKSDDAIQFSIQDYKIVIIKDWNQSQVDWFKSQRILLQLDKRTNYKFQEDGGQITLSLRNKNIYNQQYHFIKKLISMYYQQFNFSHQYLQNEFQLGLFKDILFPDLLCLKYLKNFKLKFYFQDTKIINLFHQENKNEQIHKHKIHLDSIRSIVNILKHFFSTIKSEDFNYLKLTIYEIRIEQDKKQFERYLENMDVNINIQKLKIYGVIKLPMISKINLLQKLTFFGWKEEFFMFFKENKNFINANALNILSLNALSYYSNAQNEYQNLFKNISFDSITTLKLKGNFRDFKINKSMKFKKLVTLLVSEFSQRCERKYNQNIQYGNNDYYDDYCDDYCNDQLLEQEQNSSYISWWSRYPTYIAYSYTHHDNVTCSYTNMKNCTCNNNQISKIYYGYQCYK